MVDLLKRPGEGGGGGGGGATQQPRAIFYNIFIPTKKEDGSPPDLDYVFEIIREQVDEIKKSRLLQKTPIYYTLIGNDLTSKIQDICSDLKCRELRYVEQGDEVLTLQSLYDYCAEHPDTIVTYIHDKGSFHPEVYQDNQRVLQTKGALSDECQSIVKDQCNICSARFSPLPHFHTSGNMWTAHCSYIKKLHPPVEYKDRREEFFAYIYSPENTKVPPPKENGGPNDAFLARGRYSMEHWAHGHPNVLPCDVYPGYYTWEYPGLPDRKIPWKPKLHFGARYPLPEFDIKQQAAHDPWFCGNGIFAEFDFFFHQVPPPNSWMWKYQENSTAFCAASHQDDTNKNAAGGGSSSSSSTFDEGAPRPTTVIGAVMVTCFVVAIGIVFRTSARKKKISKAAHSK
jgi:hypothetical protein